MPRPASLRLTSTAGVVSAMPIAHGASWMQLAKSIEALAPQLLEALDGGGALLRATRPNEEDDPDSLDEEHAPTRAAAPIPATSSDPETARFELFARLYSEGVKHATEQARSGNEVAFAKLCEIADIMGKRGEALERSLATTERLLHQAWRDNAEMALEAQAAAQADPLSEIIGAVSQGMGASKNGAAKPNGKA
jgi:hypothetical protein